jgi:hypothetical protein
LSSRSTTASPLCSIHARGGLRSDLLPAEYVPLLAPDMRLRPTRLIAAGPHDCTTNSSFRPALPRPLDERRRQDLDGSVRVPQGGELTPVDQRGDAGHRQAQPAGRLGQGEGGLPVDPRHRSHCPRNGPRGPGAMHMHLHEQAAAIGRGTELPITASMAGAGWDPAHPPPSGVSESSMGGFGQ